MDLAAPNHQAGKIEISADALRAHHRPTPFSEKLRRQRRCGDTADKSPGSGLSENSERIHFGERECVELSDMSARAMRRR